MKRFLFGILLLAAAAAAPAQEFTLTSPVVRSSIAKVKIKVFYFTAGNNQVRIDIMYQDSSNNELTGDAVAGLLSTVTVPSAVGTPCTLSTTLNGLAGAMNTVVGGETGSNARIQQARILGYLNTQGCFAQAGSLTP